MSLAIADISGRGHDWKERPDEEPDEELGVRRLHRGHRMATLTLTCFADEVTGNTGAVAVMNNVLSAIDIHVNALNAAKIGIGQIEPARAVVGNVNSMFEPRATAEVQLHLVSELESYVQYAEHIDMTLEVGESIEIQQWIPDPPPEP